MSTSSVGRHREVTALLDDLVAWAGTRDDLRALALVGSYARDTAGPDSDVDLILITTDPDHYRTDDAWLETLVPGSVLVREQQWGPVHERRLQRPSGLHVEFGITTPAWTATPLDSGTWRVLTDGAKTLHDPDGLLSTALRAASPRRRLQLDRGEVGLSVLELDDPVTADAPVLLVHGLAGHAGEWLPLVSVPPGLPGWAVDLRGHGHSARRPAEVSRHTLVDDLVAVLTTLSAKPVTLVGQSLGGVVALLTAAYRPDLVAGLVLVDASPARPAPEHAHRVRESLQAWPQPFPSHAHAVDFFGGGLRGHAWADGLEHRPDGWRARFDLDVLSRMAAAGGDTWSDWAAITCPTTVLRAEHDSFITDRDAEQMRTTGPHAPVITVPRSGHDIHLDRPDAVHAAIAGRRPGQAQALG